MSQPMREGFYLFDTNEARTVLAGPFDDWQAACDAVDELLSEPGRERGIETAWVDGGGVVNACERCGSTDRYGDRCLVCGNRLSA